MAKSRAEGHGGVEDPTVRAATRRTLEDIGRLYELLDARRNHATMLSPFGAGSACAGTGGIRGARLMAESGESGLVALGASDSS